MNPSNLMEFEKDVNMVIMLGTVATEPELRSTAGGIPVMNCSIVTNRSYQKDNEWVKEPTFLPMVVWKNAETLREHLHKGDRVHVVGRIQTTNWEDKDGQKRTKTEVVIAGSEHSVQIVRKKAETKAEPANVKLTHPDAAVVNLDELPF